MSIEDRRGIGAVEVLVGLLVIGLLILITIPALWSFYNKRQVRTSSRSVERVVRFARTNAVKEKRTYRIVFRDDNSSPANSVQLEILQSGSYVPVSGQTFATRYGVKILGSGPTDSMDTLVIGPRGQCNIGDVYLGGKQGIVEQVSVEATCATRLQ